jgi:hypothetical protein
MAKRIPMVVVIVFGISSVVIAGTDPLIGSWKLDNAKSNYAGRPAPGELVREYEAIPGGIRIVRELEGPDGKPTRGGWDIKLDGKDYPVKGDHRLDSLSLKRINLYTFEAVAKKDGKITNRMRWDISKDGKTLKWTSVRVLPPDEAGTVVRIYDRQ